MTARTLHTRVAWLDRWTIDGRRIINPTPARNPVVDLWDGERVGKATVYRQRLAGEQWHSLGAAIEFDPHAFRPEFMDATWTPDIIDGERSYDFPPYRMTATGCRVIAVHGSVQRRWAWDDGTLPDPILWEGAD
jgi:hypothetical protein